MNYTLILLILIFAGYIVYREVIQPKRKQYIPYWHMTIAVLNGVHKIKVPDEVYDSLKTWMRGEGDSLHEIVADNIYLGLKRAHVVSVKAVRK